MPLSTHTQLSVGILSDLQFSSPHWGDVWGPDPWPLTPSLESPCTNFRRNTDGTIDREWGYR